MKYLFDDLALAYEKPATNGRLKAQNSDFCVDEIMPIETSGEGEHLWLKIEKDGANTDWVAQQLAKCAGVKSMAVSYAGMKDRHAVTTQWFSLHLPGMDDPDFSELKTDEFKILQQARHNRKLKRGALSGNRFQIRITELEGDIESLDKKLQLIKQNGVPNYFGEQRFGREMGNLLKAEKMFNRELKKVKKQQRGLYLSSARSWIFNQILSARIKQENWLTPLPGDVFMLNGKSACFNGDGEDAEEIVKRLLDKEINITSCLWGEGESMATQEVLVLENSIAEEFKILTDGLESARLKQERRASRLVPGNLNWEIKGDVLEIEFDLPTGTYATMLLRECVEVTS
ncbi:MAG: tRNA pseudouridine(13) synthase TruD [endosymbiont of Galathealinum brachiosum]|uniref:tRNA pseudouridine synthase D n=1 Tax=endosymbiont of Galathealinum brachiosum TaxID=2200906 RepID=A0A370DJW4_9GAMM|nr:MAG: tRNA pseudouridine(13) synthase TruD [endosymbiont of Galathealinum brachiosum]